MQLPVKTQEITRRQIPFMGELANFIILSDGNQWAGNILESVAAEINRIEDLLTGADSVIKKINAQAGVQPVKVNKEVLALVSRILHTMEVAHDSFKLAACFKNKTAAYEAGGVEKNSTTTPMPLHLHIEIDKQTQTIFLTDKKWRLNFTVVAKAYAIERAKYILQQNGIASGVIKTASTITTWGKRRDGKPWTTNTVGHALSGHPFSTINISDKTIAGTDVYQCQPIIERCRNLKMVAAKSLADKINSLTIVCANAELACVLQPFLFSIGLQNSLQLVNQLQQVSGIFTDQQSVVHVSERLHFTAPLFPVTNTLTPSQPNHSPNLTSQPSL